MVRCLISSVLVGKAVCLAWAGSPFPHFSLLLSGVPFFHQEWLHAVGPRHLQLQPRTGFLLTTAVSWQLHPSSLVCVDNSSMYSAPVFLKQGKFCPPHPRDICQCLDTFLVPFFFLFVPLLLSPLLPPLLLLSWGPTIDGPHLLFCQGKTLKTAYTTDSTNLPSFRKRKAILICKMEGGPNPQIKISLLWLLVFLVGHGKFRHGLPWV